MELDSYKSATISNFFVFLAIQEIFFSFPTKTVSAFREFFFEPSGNYFFGYPVNGQITALLNNCL